MGKNPSPHGGTWAFAYASAVGGRLYAASGHLTPAEVGLPWVSNNLTEVLAILIALEQLPPGWAGEVFSDSLNAIRAVRDCGRREPPGWLPAELWGRVRRVRLALGPINFIPLGGHPTRAELAAGRRKDGKPVSGHNVHCDRLCGEEARALLRGLEVATPSPDRLPPEAP